MKLSYAQLHVIGILAANMLPEQYRNDTENHFIKNINLPAFEGKWKKVYYSLRDAGLIILKEDNGLTVSLTKKGESKAIQAQGQINYEKMLSSGSVSSLISLLCIAGKEIQKRMDNGFKLDPNSSAVEGLLEANAALFSLIEVVLPPDIVNTTTSVEKKATKKKVAKI
jgi:hypothetical protein